MPFNGSGNYQPPSGTRAVTDTVIESEKFNGFVDDLENVLNTPVSVARGGHGASTVTGAQENLNLQPGVHIQPYNIRLNSLATITGSVNKLPYLTAENTFSTTDITPFARTLLDDPNAATARQTLGVLSSSQVMLTSDIGISPNQYIRLDSNGDIPDGIGLASRKIIRTRHNVPTLSIAGGGTVSRDVGLTGVRADGNWVIHGTHFANLPNRVKVDVQGKTADLGVIEITNENNFTIPVPGFQMVILAEKVF